MAEQRQYHTVLVREDNTAPWEIHFGSFELGEAEAEQDDLTEYERAVANVKIISTNETQIAIALRLAGLNAGFGK